MIAGGALIALLPILTAAQPAERIRHVGVLVHGALPSSETLIGTALETGLRERGWIPGRNIALDYRYSEGRPERLAALATELTRLRTDLIVAHTNQAIAAAKSATATIPIVMVIAVDPVGAGFVGSLARPGGNITGLTFDVNDEIWGKRLELLREAAPGVSRVAVLWNPAYAPNRNRWKAIEEPARRLGLSLVSVEVPAGSELESRFPVMAREGARGILVLGDPMLFGLRAQIADLALKHRWPSVSPYREGADAGGLIAYGLSLPGTFRHAAVYIDRILKGAKTGELPVEQPNTFELVVNLRAAKALGLTIPPSLRVRAQELLE